MIVPAPWRLKGRGYICALSLPEKQRTIEAGTPPQLGAPKGDHSLVMFVDYTESDVGPYHELLFIPGSYRFADGHRHPSIGRIYVSSQDSVDSGRHNWGIPKELANFQVDQDGRSERISVTVGGRTVARLSLQHGVVPVPMPALLLPARYRTLAQVRHDTTYLYAPSSFGWLRSAKVTSMWGDGEGFPAIQEGQVRHASYLGRFSMRFPEARRIVAAS